MSKKTLTLVLVILLTIGGSIAYLSLGSADNDSKQEMVSQEAGTSEQKAPNTDSPTTTSSQPGAYITYSSSAITNTAGTKLLFFHAPWCPQCRALEADIQNNGVPANVTIMKVDYDTSQSLRQKYGVTLQTTVVKVDDQGNLVDKFVAYDDPSLDAIKENLL